LAEWSKA